MISVDVLLGQLGDLQLEDDLNIVLQWLLPKEHQCHPPSLRVKDSIKKIVQFFNRQFNNGFKLYYYNIVRGQYFTFLNAHINLITYTQLSKLESEFYYPLQFISILNDVDSVEDSLDNVIFSIRHYFIDTNKQFRNHLTSEIKRLIYKEDFNLCQELIKWIEESNSDNFNAKGLVLDIMLKEIENNCHRLMRGVWNDINIVKCCYDKFMNAVWPGFIRLLQIPNSVSSNNTNNNNNNRNMNTNITDDKDILGLIYDHFEKQFIDIRLDEIFELIINCSSTGPTLYELRGIISRYNGLIDEFVIKFLGQFQKFINDGSRSTTEILATFIMSIDVFIYLNIRDHYLRVLTTFIKPILGSRNDLIEIYLYSILNLNNKEFRLFNIIKPEGFEKLIYVLKGDHLLSFTSISSEIGPLHTRNKHISFSSPSITTTATATSTSLSFASNNKQDGMIIFDLLRQYQTWVPDGVSMDPGKDMNMFKQNNNINKTVSTNKNIMKNGVIYGRSNLITDCLLSIIDDKEKLITILLNIITLKLLKTPNRKLGRKYLVAYHLIYKRIRYGHNLITFNDIIVSLNKHTNETSNVNISNENNSTQNVDDIGSELIINDGQIKRYNDRIRYVTAIDEEEEIFVKFNKINVMLGDMKESDRLEKHIVQGDVRIYPKFVTSYYWNLKKTNHRDYNSDAENRMKINNQLEDKLLSYTKGYNFLRPGRVIKYCKDDTIVSITLCDSNTHTETKHDVTMSQYSIIEKFDNNISKIKIDDLSRQCGMTDSELLNAAQYWIEKGILRYKDGIFCACDMTT